LTDTNFYRGQIGVRAFQCDAQFDNVTFSNAVPLRLQLRQTGNQMQCSWPNTSVGVKLCSQASLSNLSQAGAITNLPQLTNLSWQISLGPAEPARFFLLRSE